MYYFLKIFIDGIFTALGAFIPIFILMCIHFQIRKIDYRKRKNRIKKLIEVLQLMIDTSENAMEETYKIAEVKDYVELMNKMKKSANISQYIEKKVKLMKIYKDELRSFPHPRSAEGIKTLAHYRGMEVGFQNAEAFQVVRNIKD